jgi:hypothetical protein
MTSRSPAKAPITPAAPDRRPFAAGVLDAVVGLAQHAPVLCLATLAVFLAMTALEFFYFQSLSGGLLSLDLHVLGFTPDEGMAWLTALGRRGSEIIIVWHYLTFDLLFPALFSVTLVSLVVWTGQGLPRFSALSARGQALLAVGLVLPYTLAEYAQNIAVIRLLSNFLNADPDSLALASGLTVTSSALATVPMIVIAAFYLTGRRRA